MFRLLMSALLTDFCFPLRVFGETPTLIQDCHLKKLQSVKARK